MWNYDSDQPNMVKVLPLLGDKMTPSQLNAFEECVNRHGRIIFNEELGMGKRL